MEHNGEARYRATAVLDTIRHQGRSVAWLARELKLSRQYTSDIVHGNVDVKGELAERIERTLGFNARFFVLFVVSDDIISDPLGSEREAIPA